MHARELIELAALVSAHGPVLVQSGERISSEGVEQYWTTSKVRLDRWGRSLKEFANLTNSNAKSETELHKPRQSQSKAYWRKSSPARF